mgnify:CR=1 FL=1
MLNSTQSVSLVPQQRIEKLGNMNPSHIITAVLGTSAVLGSLLIGSGKVASQSDLKEVEAMATNTRSEVHTLKTEQAVMSNDIEYIKKASDEQNVKLNKIIETLGQMQKPKKRRR